MIELDLQVVEPARVRADVSAFVKCARDTIDGFGADDLPRARKLLREVKAERLNFYNRAVAPMDEAVYPIVMVEKEIAQWIALNTPKAEAEPAAEYHVKIVATQTAINQIVKYAKGKCENVEIVQT